MSIDPRESQIVTNDRQESRPAICSELVVRKELAYDPDADPHAWSFDVAEYRRRNGLPPRLPEEHPWWPEVGA